MSPFFRPHELYDDITLDDMCPPFHPPMYPTDGESNSDTHLTPTYSVESDPLEPSYPFVIRLMSDSSSSVASQAPPLGHGRGFIRTRALPRGCGRARGGGCGDDAPGGFGNRFVAFKGEDGSDAYYDYYVNGDDCPLYCLYLCNALRVCM